MAVKVTIDENTRIITVKSGITELNVQVDLYSDLKEDWLASADLFKIEFPFIAIGGNSIGAGQVAPTYYFLKYPWVVKTNGDGDTLLVALNLYGLAENGIDTRDPFIVQSGDGVTNTASNIPGLDAEMNNAIQYASYGDAVTLDVRTSYTGTTYPVGTLQQPVNNLVDAVAIANEKGFDTLNILYSMTINTGVDLTDYTIIGRSHVSTVLLIDTSAITTGLTIKNANIMGVLDGGCHLENCMIGDLSYVNGHIHDSGLYGTIYLDGNDDAVIFNGGIVDATQIPVIDMGGSGQNCVLQDWSGGIKFQNMTDSNSRIGIQIDGGQVILDSTITAGYIGINGIGLLTDNTTGTAVVTKDGLLNREQITKPSWDTVYVDTAKGTAGTDFPIGTSSMPSNNEADAIIIATNNNINKFHITGDFIAGVGCNGCVIRGDSPDSASIDLNGVSLNNATLINITVIGTNIAHFNANDCEIHDVTNLDAHLHNCIMYGSLSVAAGETLNSDGCTFPDGVTVDLNGTGSINSANSSGILTITNATDVSSRVGITGTMVITLDASCTSGTALIGGIGILTNNSALALTDRIIPQANWDAQTSDYTDAGTTGKALSDAGSSGNPWSTPITGNTTPGSFGELVGKKLLTLAKWLGLK